MPTVPKAPPDSPYRRASVPAAERSKPKFPLTWHGTNAALIFATPRLVLCCLRSARSQRPGGTRGGFLTAEASPGELPKQLQPVAGRLAFCFETAGATVHLTVRGRAKSNATRRFHTPDGAKDSPYGV